MPSLSYMTHQSLSDKVMFNNGSVCHCKIRYFILVTPSFRALIDALKVVLLGVKVEFCMKVAMK